MGKQIVANNGELPPSVALSVAIKPIPNVGAKNIRSLPRGKSACATKRSLGLALKIAQGTGAEYDGVSNLTSAHALKLFNVLSFILISQYIGIGCNCKRWGSDHFQLDC